MSSHRRFTEADLRGLGFMRAKQALVKEGQKDVRAVPEEKVIVIAGPNIKFLGRASDSGNLVTGSACFSGS